jgi:metal-responsive CopG/Arc/MetJ family transcriptional regulator
MAITRRKSTVNATVSPYLAKRIDEGVESEDYSSQSDIVSIALAEHFVREEQREKEKKMAELYSILIQHEEGRKLLNEVPRTTKEKVEALTKAGIAHVEAGEYEEAKKCFAKAKELESQDSNDLPPTFTKKVVIE